MIYEPAGYPVCFTDYHDFEGEGHKKLLHLLSGKVTAFAGPSGVGKSTLVNHFCPEAGMDTGEVSEKIKRGKHTTRHTELYEVVDGYIVDTPGFSNVDFHGMDKYAIRDNMNEMFSFLEHCKYRDCMHIKEDGCYVKKMVECGDILKSRYDNYVHFISDKEGERR